MLRTSNMTTLLVRRHVGGSTVSASLRLIVHWDIRIGMGRGCVWVIWLSIWRRGVVLGPRIRTSSVVFAVAIVTSGLLWTVWDHLHPSRHGTSRTTTSGCIG